MEKSCADAPPHKHEVLIGGVTTKLAAHYPEFFVTFYAACLRLAWKSGFKPAKLDFVEKGLDAFESLLYEPEKLDLHSVVWSLVLAQLRLPQLVSRQRRHQQLVVRPCRHQQQRLLQLVARPRRQQQHRLRDL